MNNDYVIDLSNISSENDLETDNIDMNDNFSEIMSLINQFLDKLRENPQLETLKWSSRINEVTKLQNKINELYGKRN